MTPNSAHAAVCAGACFLSRGLRYLDCATAKRGLRVVGRIADNGQNECPGYPSEASVVDTCLQLMWSEGPPAQAACDGSCFQQHGHFLNMTNPQFTKVACGFARTSNGSLWAVQNYSP